MKEFAEVLMVFVAGYLIGKLRQKEKCSKCAQEETAQKKINAEYKDGGIVLTFGEKK